MSVHDTKIQDFTNVLKQFYAKVKALIPTKVSQLTNDKGYKTTDTTYTNFVKSGSGAKAGLVPAPPTTAGTSKYLREDGTWQATPAAVTPVNNLLATTAGSPLDAVQGKVLNDKIDGVNSSLGGLKFGTDGDGNYGYYGADGSLTPFKRPKKYLIKDGVIQNGLVFKGDNNVSAQSKTGYIQLCGNGLWITSIDISGYSYISGKFANVSATSWGTYADATNNGNRTHGKSVNPASYLGDLKDNVHVGISIYASVSQYFKVYDLWLE